MSIVQVSLLNCEGSWCSEKKLWSVRLLISQWVWKTWNVAEVDGCRKKSLLVTLASYSTNISHSLTKFVHLLNLAILTFVNFAASVLILMPKQPVSFQPPSYMPLYGQLSFLFLTITCHRPGRCPEVPEVLKFVLKCPEIGVRSWNSYIYPEIFHAFSQFCF